MLPVEPRIVDADHVFLNFPPSEWRSYRGNAKGLDHISIELLFDVIGKFLAARSLLESGHLLKLLQADVAAQLMISAVEQVFHATIEPARFSNVHERVALEYRIDARLVWERSRPLSGALEWNSPVRR